LQAFKTIFARLQDIKAGKIDEDGLGLNNVESALSRINVKLRDTPTSFRDLSAVLEEVSGKWSTLNEIEQANISKAVAGIRQQNLFNVLMQNMGKALELQSVQYNSAGLAAQRYEIYLQGVEAAQNKMTASLESLWQGGIKSGLIVQLINAGTVIIDFIDSVGGLKTILILATEAFIAFGSATLISGLLSGTSTILQYGQALLGIARILPLVTNGTIALSAANTALLTSTGIGALVVIIGIATVAWMSYAESEQKAIENSAKMREELNNTGQSLARLNDEQNTLGTLWKSYSDLQEKISELGRVSALSTEEQKKFYDIQAQIIAISPKASYYYDEHGRL
jgi:hypothetical protein